MNVDAMQDIISRYGVDGLLISNYDRFFSEYVCDQDNQLKNILGFSGSNGVGVVENGAVHIFTDGRYEIQAKEEVPGAIIYIAPLNKFSDWLKYQTNLGKKFAFDPYLFKFQTLSMIEPSNLIDCGGEIISQLLDKKDVRLSKKYEIFTLDEQYSGQSSLSKIIKLQEWLDAQKGTCFFIEDCDSIAWLLNLRSNFYEFNPTVPAKLFCSQEGFVLFIDDVIIPDKIKLYLSGLSVRINSIGDIGGFLGKLHDENLICENTCSYLTRKHAEILVNSPILEWKSNKNITEIDCFQKAHISDAAAINNFMKWFKEEYQKNNFYTEYELSVKLSDFRKKQDLYFSDSFPAIVGFQENAAVIHYRPSKAKSKLVKGDGLLLIDSGGQYYGGTTDVTRTYSSGQVNDEHKRNYTLVLKGHIAASSLIFDGNTCGADIDKLARKHLIAEGLDYQHGTGHGVGSFLNVHEGPYSISKYSDLPLKENLIFSIEPGYYKAGSYGIRLENLYVIQKNSSGKLYFEPLTLVPFENELIDFEMLTVSEKEWLDKYHQQVNQLAL